MVETALWENVLSTENWQKNLIFLPKFWSGKCDPGKLDKVEITAIKENSEARSETFLWLIAELNQLL